MKANGLDTLANAVSGSSSASSSSTRSTNEGNKDNNTKSPQCQASHGSSQKRPSEQVNSALTGTMINNTDGGTVLAAQWQPHRGGITGQNLTLLAGLQTQVPPAGLQVAPAAGDSASILNQQLSYISFLMQAQKAANQASSSLAQTSPISPAGLAGLSNTNQALQLALLGQAGSSIFPNKELPPNAGAPTASSLLSSLSTTNAAAGMPPPSSGASSVSSSLHTSVLTPQYVGTPSDSKHESHITEKKQLKRAANRRSAQLSRKRKKQFIEELKDENDDLRRKEQILKAIPDLVLVFDSSGKLWFVSQSVSRFLQFTASELRGTSFWDRLCDDSVRLLKAAFMDSLAARQPDSDTAPLGSGVWELRLVDRDGSRKIVTLNGVVHFAGERPECICSIRPRDGLPGAPDQPVHSSSGGTSYEQPSSLSSNSFLVKAKPSQSVIGHGSVSDSTESRQPRPSTSRQPPMVVGRGPEAFRISDSGNSSYESESGSSDEPTGSSS